MSIFARIDELLTQTRVYRMLAAGIYVKMQGRWYSCHQFLILNDGSRILRRDDLNGGTFHETFSGIQALEDYT